MADPVASMSPAETVAYVAELGAVDVEFELAVEAPAGGTSTDLEVTGRPSWFQPEPGTELTLRFDDRRGASHELHAIWREKGTLDVEKIVELPENDGEWPSPPPSVDAANLAEDSGLGPREAYRIDVGPDVGVALSSPDGSWEASNVEALDVSLGGIGLAADPELAVEECQTVDVHLQIPETFDGTIRGEVAYVSPPEQPAGATGGHDDELVFGVDFEPLDRRTREQLGRALDGLLREQVRAPEVGR